jgi:hypothetical protein
MTLIVELPAAAASDAASARAVADSALAAAEAVAEHGAALLLPEPPADGVAHLDPSVLAGLLSASATASLVIEADTGRHAPYNLARRVQSLARILPGRIGVLLRAGGLDPVTAASAQSGRADADAVLAEYASVLRALQRSFPQEALRGDREAGLLADASKLAPAEHRGESYVVAGALNVPLDPALRAAVLGPDHVDGPFDQRVGPATGSLRRVLWAPDLHAADRAGIALDAVQRESLPLVTATDDGVLVVGDAVALAGALDREAPDGAVLHPLVSAGRLAVVLNELLPLLPRHEPLRRAA